MFKSDIKYKSGGIIISDNNTIILGKSNILKREDTYESFGGRVEINDISSLHTALREFVEEFFNNKLSLDQLNMMAIKVKTNNIILKQCYYFGMTYLINFNGLNQIFIYLCEYIEELKKYNKNDMFDLNLYIMERIILDQPKDGMNEIKSLHIFTLDDIKNKKVKLRWFTDKIISKLL
jgi:hypothetical protein